MRRLYVRTDDVRLAHRLLNELQERNLPAKQVSLGDTIEPDAYWFGTSEEVAELGGCGVAVDPDAVSEAISTWLLARQVHSPPEMLVVGIDPGPRPGCAFVSEGVLMGKREMESIDQALDEIVKLVDHLLPGQVLVRIGHGSPVHRDRLLNRVLSLGFHVEIVNEHRTSAGQRRHAHGSAAVKIAMMAGKAVHEQRTVNPTTGELRNLQRISRQRSKGRLTISLETARRVSEGLLTMDEALAASGFVEN